MYDNQCGVCYFFKISMNKYLIIFYTEGHPYDRGMHLRDIAFEVKEKLSENFTDIFCYNKRDLKKMPEGDKICNEYDREVKIPLSNKIADKIGFYDFKPFLIKHILNETPEESLIFWQDVNFKKYPQYWETEWDCFEKYLEHDIFVSREILDHKLKNSLSRKFIRHFFNDSETEMLLECWNFNAGKLLLRNTKLVRQFISEWNDLCLNKELMLLHDEEPHRDFIFNCCDQNILNILIYQYIQSGKLPIDFPKFYFKNRTWNDTNKLSFENMINTSFLKV